MKCSICGEVLPLRSNLAIAEEARRRLVAYLDLKEEASCPNNACAKHGVPLIVDPQNYVQFGKTAAGTRCNTCRKTFTANAKAPFNRIAEIPTLTKQRCTER